MGIIFHGKCTSKARLDGKTAIITGSNTGIGKWTALDFAKRGAKVIMACRNTTKGEEAAKWIRYELLEQSPEPKGSIQVMRLDLSSLDSVREFADNIIRNEPQIHLLVNNAGVMGAPYELTEDGYEMHFATNHLGHFLLTLLLMPTLLASAPARIVNVSSLIHIFCWNLDLTTINSEKNYGPFMSYSRSKICNIFFTRKLAKLLEGTGVTVYAVHPGVVKTELSRHLNTAVFSSARSLYDSVIGFFIKSPEQGAQTQIYCAVDENVAKETGQYYSDCSRAWIIPHAKNQNKAEELWEKSVEFVGLDNWEQLFIKRKN